MRVGRQMGGRAACWQRIWWTSIAASGLGQVDCCKQMGHTPQLLNLEEAAARRKRRMASAPASPAANEVWYSSATSLQVR